VLHVSCPKVVSWIPQHKLAHHNALKSNFALICEDTRESASLLTRSGLRDIQLIMSNGSFCFDGLRVLGILACQTLVPGFDQI
jgi:hypothetical protein